MEEHYATVMVTSVEYHGGSIAQGYGTTEDGRACLFYGEPRYLADMAEALNAGEDVTAAVPSWSLRIVGGEAE